MAKSASAPSVHICVRFVIVLIALFFLIPGVVAVEQLMALHGKAVSSGSAIASGDLRVLIYDANQGGNLVYDSGSDFNSSIVNSFFDVMLGSNTILDLNYGRIYYMDIRVNDQDLNFGGTDRRVFESSRGTVEGTSIYDGTITNADINVSAAIDWNKISKTGSRVSDLGLDADFNATYAKQADVNQWFVKSADINNVYYTQADANNVLLKKTDANFIYYSQVDANNIFPKKAGTETISGTWNFTNPLLGSGGFSSGGLTLQNGIGYFQSIVVLNDFNAATVTGIDLNGHYLPDPDNTWDLGSDIRRFRKIYGVDANFSGNALIGTLTLSNALAVSSGGTGNTSFPTGGIVFSNGTILTSDANFFWNSASDRLGIGTGDPQNALNVAGDANFTGNVYAGINTLFANTSTGRVGIGTVSPANALNVVGDLNVTGSSYLGNVIISATDINVNNVNSKDGNLVFRSNTGFEFGRFVGSSGFAGIGTTDPTRKLHVVGDANIDGSLAVTGDLNASLSWFLLKDYPAACPSGQFISAVGDTVTCTTIPGGGGGRIYTGFSPIVIDNDLNTVALNVLASTDWNGLFDGREGSYYLNFGNDTNRLFSLLTLDNNSSFDSRYLKISDTNNTARVNFGAIGGLTAGRLVFASSGGTPSQDGNLFWDNALKTLGVGTSAPTNAVTIVGDFNVTRSATSSYPSLFVAAADGNTGIRRSAGSSFALDVNGDVRASGDLNIEKKITTTDLNVVGTATISNIPGFVRDAVFNASFPVNYDTNISNRPHIPSDANIDSNVEAILALRVPWADANVSDDIAIKSSKDANFWNYLSTNRVYSVDNNSLSFFTNGSERVSVLADGNVGVGSTSPNARFLVSNTASTGLLALRVDANALDTTGQRTFVITNDGNVAIGKNLPAAGLKLDVNGDASISGTLTVGALAGLNIPSEMSIDGNIEEALAARVPWADVNVANDITIKSSKDANFWQYLSTNRVYSVDNNSFSVFTNGVERLTIITDGNIGIGTSTPKNSLNIAGDLNVTGSAFFGSAIFGSLTATTMITDTIKSATGDIAFQDNSGNERVRFKGSFPGIGIGTDDPQQELEIATLVPNLRLRDRDGSAGSSTAILEFGGTVGGAFSSSGYVGDSSGSLQSIDLFGDTGSIVRIGTNNTEVIRVSTDGNVGILTTEPTNRLNVVGDFNVVTSLSATQPSLFVSKDGNTGVRTTPGQGYALDVNGNQRVAGDINVTGTATIGTLVTGNIAGFVTDSVFNSSFPVQDANLATSYVKSSVFNAFYPVADANIDNNITLNDLNQITNRPFSRLSDRNVSLIAWDTNAVLDGRYAKIADVNAGFVTDAVFNASYPWGDANVANDITLKSSKDANFWQYLSTNRVYSVDNNSLAFFTNGSERIAIATDGNINADSGTLFISALQDRVGIGTTTPANTLNVIGDANITGTLYAGTFTGTVTGYVREAIFNASWPVYDANIDNNLTIDTNQSAIFRGNVISRADLNAYGGLNTNTLSSLDNNALNIRTRDIARLTITADGNVGLNNTAPKNRLSLIGDVNIATSASALPSIYISAVDGNIAIAGTSVTSGYRVDLSGSQRITADLNVGRKITTTDLNVLGTATIGTLVTSNIAGFVTDSVFNGSYPWGDANISDALTINTASYVVTRGDLNAYGGLNANLVRSLDNNSLTFQTNNLGRVIITAADGNVGVGTLSPGAGFKLDVNGSQRVSGDLNVGKKVTAQDLNVVGTAVIGTLVTGDIAGFVRDSVFNASFPVNYDTNVSNRPHIPTDATIDANVQALLASGAGLVPWADVNIANNITLDDLNQVTNRPFSRLSDRNISLITWDTNGVLDGRYAKIADVNSGFVTDAVFNASYPWMDANVDNNLTIDTNQGAFFRGSLVSRADLNAYGGLNANTIRSFDNNALSLQTQNTARITVTADGDVGIGVSPVNFALDVNNTNGSSAPLRVSGINTAGLVSNFRRVSTLNDLNIMIGGSNVGMTFSSSGNKYALGYKSAGNAFKIVTLGQSVSSAANILDSNSGLIIASDGNVGIGAAAGSGFRLDVNGDERVSGDLNVAKKITTTDLNVLGTATIGTLVTGNIAGFVRDSVFNSSFPIQDANLANSYVKSSVFNAFYPVADANIDNNITIDDLNRISNRPFSRLSDRNVSLIAWDTNAVLDGRYAKIADVNAGFVTDAVFNASYPWMDANVDNNLTIDTNQTAVFRGNVIARSDLNAYGGLNANTIRSFDNNALNLQTLNTTRLTIAPDGNVGIGTSLPKQTLNVSGDINVSPGGAPAFLAANIGGNNKVGINTNAIASASNVRLHVSYDGKDVNSGLVTSDPIILTAENTAAGFSIIVAGNSSSGIRPVFKGTRARGTLATPLTPQKDDDILTFLSAVYDSNFGGGNQATAGIFFKLDQIPDANVLGQRISFVTSDSNAAQRQERMVIKADGNVGINTTSPANKLNIIGDLNIISSATTGYPSLYVAGADGNTGIRRTPASGYALDVNGNVRFSDDLNVLGTATIGTLVTGNIAGFVTDSVFNAAWPVADANVVNNLTIKSSNDANFWSYLSTNRVYSVDNNGFAIFTNGSQRLTVTAADGNVGVGTTTPGTGFKLDVNGDVRFAGDLNVGKKVTTQDLNVAGTAVIGTLVTGDIAGFVRDSVFNASFPVNYDTNVSNRPHIPTDATIDANVQALLASGAGLVPWADVNIANNITLDDLNQVTNRPFSRLSDRNVSLITWDTNAVLDGRYAKIADVNSGFVTDAVFNASYPWGDANVVNNLTIKSSNDANFWSYLSTNRVYSVDNNSLSLFTNGSERVTVAADGNVGIGSSTPSAKFLISNTASSSLYALRVDANSQDTAGRRTFVITNDGNVAIGRTLPGSGYKLDVNGDARFDGIITVTGLAGVHIPTDATIDANVQALLANGAGLVPWADVNVADDITAINYVRNAIFNASYPWQDANVADDITVTNYVHNAVFNSSYPWQDANIADDITVTNYVRNTVFNAAWPVADANISALSFSKVIFDSNAVLDGRYAKITDVNSGFVTDAVFNASFPVLDANVDNNLTIDTNKAAVFRNSVITRADTNAYAGVNTNTLRSLDNNSLSIQTNNTARITLTADGNTGIGTATPKNKLEVAGDVNLSTATPTLTLGTAQVYKTAGGELVIST